MLRCPDAQPALPLSLERELCWSERQDIALFLLTPAGAYNGMEGCMCLLDVLARSMTITSTTMAMAGIAKASVRPFLRSYDTYLRQYCEGPFGADATDLLFSGSPFTLKRGTVRSHHCLSRLSPFLSFVLAFPPFFRGVFFSLFFLGLFCRFVLPFSPSFALASRMHHLAGVRISFFSSTNQPIQPVNPTNQSIDPLIR